MSVKNTMSHGARKSIDKRMTKEHEEETAVFEEIELLQGETGITHCILKNCLDMLVNSLNDEANHELTPILVDQRNADGRSPLELCAILGRDDIGKVLLKFAANVNLTNCGGYTPAHYAASWGQTDVLKLLIEANADLTLTNSSGETPRVMALRYGQMECVDFMDWIAAKTGLEAGIKRTQDSIVEKRPTKEEKTLILNLCKERQAWLESVVMPTTQDFIVQLELLEAAHTAIITKTTTTTSHRAPSARKSSICKTLTQSVNSSLPVPSPAGCVLFLLKKLFSRVICYRSMTIENKGWFLSGFVIYEG